MNMKIALISKADAFGGGASRVADDLALIFRNNNHFVHRYMSWSGKGFDESNRALFGRFSRVIWFARRLEKKIGLPELLPFELGMFIKNNKVQNYDIFHFHDLSSAISPLTLLYLAKKKPVVWTIHDCSPFTAGCLYPMDCEKFKHGCGNCPQLGTWPLDTAVDLTKILIKIKEITHRQQNLVTITPSNWMADMAYSSGLFSERPLVIPNGVDVEVFKPSNKDELKKKWGLPLDRPIILLSAGNILDERKGTLYALKALKAIKDLRPFLWVIGQVNEKAKEILSEFNYKSPGYVSDPQLMNECYGLADIFLFCSLADNQPLTILETMAAGTPLIGFATGGIPDIVEQGHTGILVPPKDVSELIFVLRNAIEKRSYRLWSKNARSKVEKEYSYEQLYEKHLKLYEKLISHGLSNEVKKESK